MSDEPIIVSIAIGGVSEEVASGLSRMINATLAWRLSLEDGDELQATDDLVDSIDDFVALLGNQEEDESDPDSDVSG